MRKVTENQFALFFKMMPDMISEYWRFAKGNARANNSVSPQKRLTDILMLTHALEKGFSSPNLRKSFGRAKALKLMSMLEGYCKDFGWDDSLSVSVSLLNHYNSFHENNGISDSDLDNLNQRLELFKSINRVESKISDAGTYDKTKVEMCEIANGDFRMLCEGRYSVRDFGEEPVADNDILDALKIASKSPSACNRQSYRAHIFSGDNKNRLLEIQGGSGSFYRQADKVILITADLNRYYTKEMHLGYIDGSLFAMSLIYALTYKGIASIPLTLSIGRKKLKNISDGFSLPENEMPIMMIAVGNYSEKFKVAMSHRNTVDSFTTFHR